MNINILRGTLTAVVLLIAQQNLRAVPILQLYLEGGVYDLSTETWEITPLGSSGGAPFRLWVIGNVDGAGGKGTIFDVRLSVAYDQEFLGLDVTLTPTQAGGSGTYEGILFDPSTPSGTGTQNTVINTSAGVFSGEVVTDGSQPTLGDGSTLPSHGQFGVGKVWEEFALGDFSSTDSPIGDFSPTFPTTLSANAGQINVYDVSVTGGSGATLHFDAYDHVGAGNKAKYKFAPFSHDGEGNGGSDASSDIIPEPSTWIIFSGLAICFGVNAWRKKRMAA